MHDLVRDNFVRKTYIFFSHWICLQEVLKHKKKIYREGFRVITKILDIYRWCIILLYRLNSFLRIIDQHGKLFSFCVTNLSLPFSYALFGLERFDELKHLLCLLLLFVLWKKRKNRKKEKALVKYDQICVNVQRCAPKGLFIFGNSFYNIIISILVEYSRN